MAMDKFKIVMLGEGTNNLILKLNQTKFAKKNKIYN